MKIIILAGIFGALLAMCGIGVFSQPAKALGLIAFFSVAMAICSFGGRQ